MSHDKTQSAKADKKIAHPLGWLFVKIINLAFCQVCKQIEYTLNY
ncbi:hypothetical protein [Nostoc sp.]